MRNFADTTSKKFWQMDRQFKIDQVDPEVKCWRRRIYDEDTDDKLTEIENSAAVAISSVLKGNASRLTPDQNKTFLEFIWSLHIRSLEWGDFKDETGYACEKDNHPLMNKEEMRAVRRDWLLDHPDLMAPLPKSHAMNHHLYFFNNETQYEFCTSDCPTYRLILDNTVTIESFRPDGIGTGFILPLDPKNMVIAIPNERTTESPWSSLPTETKISDVNMIGLQNLMTCFNSEKLVFARRQDELNDCASVIYQTPGKLPQESLLIKMIEASIP